MWSSPRISTQSLGPQLFILYINDVAETIRCKLGIFTDDTKFYSIINSVKNVECDLDGMQEWSRTWLLNVNLEKCKVMHIGKLPNISYSMKISTSPGSFMELSEVNFEKNLCVWSFYLEAILTL